MTDQEKAFRHTIAKKLTIKQQQTVNAGNEHLLSMPFSAKWLLIRFYYQFLISLFDIAINFIGQNNFSWFIFFTVSTAFFFTDLQFGLNFFLVFLLMISLFFLGNAISYKKDFNAFLFTASLFLTLYEINFLLLMPFLHFTKPFLFTLLAVFILANLGFLVIISFAFLFFKKFFIGVKRWRKKEN